MHNSAKMPGPLVMEHSKRGNGHVSYRNKCSTRKQCEIKVYSAIFCEIEDAEQTRTKSEWNVIIAPRRDPYLLFYHL